MRQMLTRGALTPPGSVFAAWRGAAFLATAALAVAACGGSVRPSSANARAPEGATKASADDGTSEDGSDDASSSDAPSDQPAWMKRSGQKGGKLTDADRPKFLHACQKTDAQAAFCECSFGVAKENPDATQSVLSQKMAARCAEKLPETTVRATFVNGCQKDGPSFKPYCECMWPQIRKSFTVVDLVQTETAKSPRFSAAVKAGAVACSAKIPESAVQRGFFKGCTEGDEGKNAYCACAWRVVRAEMSVPEIVAPGASTSPKMRAVTQSLPSKCGAFRKQ
jgi:hypothetical protein